MLRAHKGEGTKWLAITAFVYTKTAVKAVNRYTTYIDGAMTAPRDEMFAARLDVELDALVGLARVPLQRIYRLVRVAHIPAEHLIILSCTRIQIVAVRRKHNLNTTAAKNRVARCCARHEHDNFLLNLH